MEQKYEDWAEVMKKVETDIKNAEITEVGISIAKECQTLVLEHIREKIKTFPKPVIMEPENKSDEPEGKIEETKEETPEEAPSE